MKRLRPLLCTALAVCCLPMIVSCASRHDDESTVSYNRKLREKNDKYYERQEKKKMRIRARQKRVDMWYKGLMN
jgi:hypothetical protein